MPHCLLLRKMSALGFSDGLLDWVSSYLVGRTFRVRHASCLSDAYPTRSEVSQGLILGPLFFLIFINDLTKEVACPILLYADDVKLFQPIRSEEDCAGLQSDIDGAWNWFVKNRLPLHRGKTLMTTFSRKSRESVLRLNYYIDNNIIERQALIKDLEIIFDAPLRFTQHVDYIVSRARRTLGIVRWVGRHFSMPDTMSSKFLDFLFADENSRKV